MEDIKKAHPYSKRLYPISIFLTLLFLIIYLITHQDIFLICVLIIIIFQIILYQRKERI